MATLQTKILRYTLLPGFVPRIYAMFASGFTYVPFLIATIYQIAGILPPHHVYLDPRNIGRFGIRHVIAEAANNLIVSRKHADQVIIFVIILLGVVLIFAQMLLFFMALVIQQPSFALPPPQDILKVTSVFNSGPTQDLAFIILDRVFGVTGIFNSCVSTGAACVDLNGNPLPLLGAYPSPFHQALHALLRFYTLGVFHISIILIIYFIITITAETASSGTPFGQRFNRAWAPIRLIVCFALLMPLNTGGSNIAAGVGTNAGFNAAQLITFWAAKTGSNFASNAWGRFNNVMVGTYLGNTLTLIGTPAGPKVNELARFMFVAKTCQVSENYLYGHLPNGIQAYLVREKQATPIVPGPNFLDFRTTAFPAARDFSNYGNIFIVFGVQDSVNYRIYKGDVKPFCGEMRVSVSDLDRAGPASGATTIQQLYYDMVKAMWNDASMAQYASCVRDRTMQHGQNPNCAQWPDQAYVQNINTLYQNSLDANLPAAVNAQVANGNWGVSPSLRAKGWAGAAIWYNRLAELNGDVATAVQSQPQPGTYPLVMEEIAAQRRMNNEKVNAGDIFDPDLANGLDINYSRTRDREIAQTLNTAYTLWIASGSSEAHFVAEGQGPVIDTINAIFGTHGIFQMRCNTNIHPLAQLSMLGKGMMYAAFRNFTGGTALSLGGGLLKGFDDFTGELAKVAGGFFQSISTTTMAMSFILYYVLPFMPFIYFLFAVSGWVKAIFEAIVAMPLWALAHIRIDGNGLPGPAATHGYFLIMEIFLRPVLILLGLMACIQAFSATVVVLNQVFDLVVSNVSGFGQNVELSGVCGASKLANKHGPIDNFFYTVVYVVMCYMLGLGCFKLIDEIPNTILRWAGISVSTFNEQAGDIGGKLLQQSYQLSTLATQKIEGGKLAGLLSLNR